MKPSGGRSRQRRDGQGVARDPRTAAGVVLHAVVHGPDGDEEASDGAGGRGSVDPGRGLCGVRGAGLAGRGREGRGGHGVVRWYECRACNRVHPDEAPCLKAAGVVDDPTFPCFWFGDWPYLSPMAVLQDPRAIDEATRVLYQLRRFRRLQLKTAYPL